MNLNERDDQLERRSQRSPLLSQSLEFQLQQVAQRYLLDAMVLTDGQGRMMAASSKNPAYIPLASFLVDFKPEMHGDGLCYSDLNGQPVTLKELRIGEAKLYLAALGELKRSVPALAHASSGIERILGVLVSSR